MSTLQDRLAAARLRQTPHRQAPERALSFPARVFAVLAAWRRRARSRADLARFSDYELRDIGLTRAEVERECLKPFWRE